MKQSKFRFTIFLLLAFSLIIAAGCGKRNESRGGAAAESPSASPSASDSTSASPTASESSAPAESPSAAPSGSGSNPVVTILMDNGKSIKLELYPEVAPNTVNNFISLIGKGFYDGTIFHRVIPGFMIQGGDPDGTGTGGPGYTIKGEFTNNGFKNDLKHTPGVLSMARQSMPLDSAGSQFFIMVADYPSLDGDYAAFGKVTEGMDTVNAIVNQEIDPNDPQQSKPLKPMAIKKMTVDTKGITYKQPEVIKSTNG